MVRALRVPLIIFAVELLAAFPVYATNGSLKVTSFPSGATVVVDGITLGNTTPMSISLPVGTHVVKVQIAGSGWAPAESTVTIVPGNNDLSVTLLPALTQGPPGPQGPQGPQGPPGIMSQAAGPCFDDQNRYVDCGNGTVTDTVTGLIWLKDASCLGLGTYAAANQAVAELTDGDCGLTDGSSAGNWRLPTKAEGQATIAHAVAVLGCTSNFSGVPPSLTNDLGTDCLAEGPTSFTGVINHYIYWSSSTSDSNLSHGYSVDLYNGGVLGRNRHDEAGVWPVRSGR